MANRENNQPNEMPMQAHDSVVTTTASSLANTNDVTPEHQTFKNSVILIPEINERYQELEIEFQILRVLVIARKQAGMTQADVARKIGTTASTISRLESGGGKYQHSPSLRTLKNYAAAVNCRLEFSLIKNSEESWNNA